MSKELMIITVIASMLVGMLATVIVFSIKRSPQPTPVWAYSFGYNEQDNNWNRIRVDRNGHVICSGESK